MKKIEIPEGQYLAQQEADVMAEYLSKLPEEGRLLELGTGYGHSTAFFANLLPKWKIYTVDGYGLHGTTKEEGKIYDTFDTVKMQEVLESLAPFKNVVTIIGDTNRLAWEDDLQLDVIFIDACHDYKSVLADFVACHMALREGGYVFFHDYHRTDYGVRRLVEEICANDQGRQWRLLYGHKMAVVKKGKFAPLKDFRL